MAFVKSLMYQITSIKNRRKVEGDFWTNDEAVPGEPFKDWIQYLDKLFTYLLALASSGVVALPGAPAAKDENKFGAICTNFVTVAWYVLQK